MSEPFKELDIFLTQVLPFAHCQVYFVSFPFLSVNIDDVNVLKILYQIAAGVSLDILPGPSDPANFSLPQQVFLLNMSFKFVLLLSLEASDCSSCCFLYLQPLNRCLFPGSSVYNTFRSCTNPHSFELDRIR